MDYEKARRAVHYLFTLVTLAFFFSGLGITEYRTIEPLTGYLFTKTIAFQLHYLLTIPFIVLLALHIYLVLMVRKNKEKNKKK